MGCGALRWVATGSAAAVLGAKRLILASRRGKVLESLPPTWKPAFLGLGCRLLQRVARDKRDMQTD